MQAKRVIAGLTASVGFWAAPAISQTLSTYGTPGLVDMPTAQVLNENEVALTSSVFGKNIRNTFTFQVLPRVYGSFRYSIIRDFSPGGANDGDLFDRSFDLHYQILDERSDPFSLAVGLRDFGGTGVYQGEYLVATKTLADRLRLSAGMGWGRLAQRGSFSNPLGSIDDRFDNRPGRGSDPGGQFSADNWFRGPAAIFAGAEYQFNDQLSFQLEYSTDAYEREASTDVIDIDTPFNVGMSYRFDNGSSLRAFVIGGTEVGLQYSYVFNPAERSVPAGLDTAPLPIPPRNQALLASADLTDPAKKRDAEETLKRLMADEGIALQALSVTGNRATARVENRRWNNEAQAVGRAARAMANALPAYIDIFTITFQKNLVPISSVTIARSDLEELETDFDGAWKTLARSQIEDAPITGREDELPGVAPSFEFGLGPYTQFSFFDPDSPLRYEVGAELTAAYRLAPGLTFAGRFRQPVLNTIDNATRESDSVLPRVRTDFVEYAQQSNFRVDQLTAEYMFRPGKDLFGRVSAGYLETMFGGVSAELLWYPIDSRFALGAEINYARQRDFDVLFGFQDYDVVTGHASAYYDLGNGFRTQLDVGRYLAGDWGATFTLDREFNNGVKIGGFFTLTDVTSAEFGEGSFDKGIRIQIPFSWLSGVPTQNNFTQVIRPTLRDGGARLNVSNRLYDVTRDYRAQDLTKGWGRLFR